MLTISIFNQNPTTSQRMSRNGKKFFITTKNGYDMNWEVPDTSTYENAEIVISGGPKNEEFYRYSSEGNTQLSKLPAGLKQRIVDDWNTLTEESFEVEEDAPTDTQKVVREETHNDVTITMTLTENSLDLRAGDDRMFYTVTSTKGYSKIFQTQFEAESKFDYLVGYYNPNMSVGSKTQYRGFTIGFNISQKADGTNRNFSAAYIASEDDKVESWGVGDTVKFNDGLGMREFGIISEDENADIEILKEYIDAKLDKREDTPVQEYGSIPVMSWGFYNDNLESTSNPFSTVKMEEVFTLSQTDGRILGLKDDDFIAAGYDSGALKLVVKNGYRVRVKIMTQNRDYFTDNLTALDSVVEHTQTENNPWLSDNPKTNYDDTDKLTVDLFGGDSLEIDIDGVVDWADHFNIKKNGSSIVRGAPSKINDETFVAITQVERFSPNNGGGGGSGQVDDDDETTFQNQNGLAIAVGIGLILLVTWLVIRGGDE